MDNEVKKNFLLQGGDKDDLDNVSCFVIDTFIGDLNGDDIDDGLVRYGSSWGGNAASIGLAAFLVKDENLELACMTEEFYVTPIKISKNIIHCEKRDYATGDANCCPSIITEVKLQLKGNKLVKIK